MDEDFIAKRIAELRILNGISARDMSLSIGQNPSYINYIENKKTMPSMKGFFYICEYFNITPKQFFDLENKNPEVVDDIIVKLKMLDSEKLSAVSMIVKALIGE